MRKQIRKLVLTIFLSLSRVSKVVEKDIFIPLTTKKSEKKLKDRFLLAILNGNIDKDLLQEHYDKVSEISNTKNVKYVKKTFSSFDENNQLIKHNDFVPVLMDENDIEFVKKRTLNKLDIEPGFEYISSWKNSDKVKIKRNQEFKPLIMIMDHCYNTVLSKYNDETIIEFYCDSYNHNLIKHFNENGKNIDFDAIIDKDLFTRVSNPFNLSKITSDIDSIVLDGEVYSDVKFFKIKNLDGVNKNKFRFVIKFKVNK